MRRYSKLDKCVAQADQAIRTLNGVAHSVRTTRSVNNLTHSDPATRIEHGNISDRPRSYPPGYPPESLPPRSMSRRETRRSGRLMRVNHAGEIAAQALYQGQAATCTNPLLRESLGRAASEEADHLYWCRRRLDELGIQDSKLGWFWYLGAFVLGAVAGAMGDRVNLGFLAETERQVVKHLENHLALLPEHDDRSRLILVQMQRDEQAHQRLAEDNGAIRLPWPITRIMRLSSRVMTIGAYWV